MSEDVEDWGGVDDLDDDADGDLAAAQPDEPQLYYPTVEAFVTDYLVEVYRRHVDGRTRTWCPQWWRHAEAIARLEAIWRAWEHLRLDAAFGASVWFREHADPHMAVLLDPDGPFKYCSPDKGHIPRTEPLPLDTAPDGLFAASWAVTATASTVVREAAAFDEKPDGSKQDM